MPQINIFLSDVEDSRLIYFSKEWGMSKYETLKKIIRDFSEKENDNGNI